MKTPTDSVLFQLTAERQTKIFDWLQSFGYSETIKRIAAPEPEGLGLKTHRSSLHRFYQRYSEREAVAREVSGLIKDAGNNSPALFSAVEGALQHVAFELATSPAGPRSFSQLSRWVLKCKADQQKTEFRKIADERLALVREPIELHAARLALKHFVQLQEIHGDSTLDDEAKIRAARELFSSASVFKPRRDCSIFP